MVYANQALRGVCDAHDQSRGGIRKGATEMHAGDAGHADRLPHVEQHRCDAEQERGAADEPGSFDNWIAVVGTHGSGRSWEGSGTVTDGTDGTGGTGGTA